MQAGDREARIFGNPAKLGAPVVGQPVRLVGQGERSELEAIVAQAFGERALRPAKSSSRRTSLHRDTS